MDVWLNGSFVTLEEARISLFDAGLQHGVGLFETMRASRGQLVQLEEHLDRLASSARSLSLTSAVKTEPLGDAIRQSLDAAACTEARVRVTLTGGDLNMLSAIRAGRATIHDPTIAIVVQPATEYPAQLAQQGIRVSIAEDRLSDHDRAASHKTLNYWPRLRALQEAAQSGCSEALWLSTRGQLAGACTSNVFLVRDGMLVTPLARGDAGCGEVAPPVLPGTVRRAMIQWAGREGIRVECRAVQANEVMLAEEIVLTNSSWGVMPVAGIEAHDVGSGVPGPIGRRMQREWDRMLSSAG